MKRLEKIYFLIHGFCYAVMIGGRSADQLDDRFRRYYQRENACAERWFSRLGELSDAEALVIIPFGKAGQTIDYYAAACAKLGERCFILDSSDCLTPEFWAGSTAEHDHNRSLIDEIRSALVHQQMAWNKEELYTALHSLACCWQFKAMLAERNLYFDPATVTAEAWGASFDGCVTKYTLNLRRILGLSKAICIDFDLTVPDAFFLLDAELEECVLLDNGLRLFLFNCEDRVAGLYTLTQHSLADPPADVILTVDPEMITVKSKQGIRLWPQPEAYILLDVEPGYYEPPQAVVKRLTNGIQLPVNAGYVYRLAKAPAYVFMPVAMPHSDARSILVSARLR